MDLKETYNKIAEDWHKDHQADDWWIEGTDKFLSFLDPNSLILDVGCGAGTKSKHLTERGVRVFGIDFSEKMIDIAKRVAPNAEFHLLDIINVNQLRETFDGIFMQAVLLHVPKIKAQKYINILTKKLKPNGYFYIAVKCKRSDGAEEEMKVENDYGYSYQRFFSYFTIDEIRNYFTSAGLVVVNEKITLPGKTNWIQIIAQKN